MKRILRTLVALCLVADFTLTPGALSQVSPVIPSSQTLLSTEAMTPRALLSGGGINRMLRVPVIQDSSDLLRAAVDSPYAPYVGFGVLAAGALALTVFAPAAGSGALLAITICAPWNGETRDNLQALPHYDVRTLIPDQSLVVFQSEYYVKLEDRTVIHSGQILRGYTLMDKKSEIKRRVWARARDVRPATAQEAWYLENGITIVEAAQKASETTSSSLDRSILAAVMRLALAGRPLTSGTIAKEATLRRIDTLRDRGIKNPMLGVVLQMAYRHSLSETDAAILNAIQESINQGEIPEWEALARTVGISRQSLRKRRRVRPDLDRAFSKAEAYIHRYQQSRVRKSIVTLLANIERAESKSPAQKTAEDRWLLRMGAPIVNAALETLPSLRLRVDFDLVVALLHRAMLGQFISNGMLRDDTLWSAATISNRTEAGAPLAALFRLAFDHTLTPTDAAILSAIDRLVARGVKLKDARIAREADVNRATVLRRRKQNPEIQSALSRSA